MFMFIFLYGIHLVILGILYFTFNLYTKPHKNVILETTLTDEQINQPETKSVILNFRKKLKKSIFYLALAALPLIFINYDSIALIFYLTLTFVTFGVAQLILISGIREMQLMKKAQGWLVNDDNSELVRIDTTLSQNKNQKSLAPTWFIPLVLVPIIFISLGLNSSTIWAAYLWINLLFLGMVGLMFLAYYFILRLPAKVLTDDSLINQQCNDILRRNWSLMAVLSGYYVVLLELIINLAIFTSTATITWISLFLVLITLGFLALVCYLIFSARKKQDDLLTASHKYLSAQEDSFWRYGFYNNPHDSRTMVQDRLGMNMSLNLGNKSGRRTLTIIMTLTLSLLVILSTMMLRADFSKHAFTMAFTDTAITLKAPLASSATLAYQEIEDIALIDELPKSVRVNGTGTAHYATGKFKVPGEKELANFYIDHRSEKIIKITSQGHSYYFTNQKTSETEENYQRLVNKLK